MGAGAEDSSAVPCSRPAENERLNLTGNAHSGWYRKQGHITWNNPAVTMITLT